MTAVKLQRERSLAARRREKLERRTGSSKEVVRTEDGVEDPDLAGIQLGPQPPQDWQLEE